MFRVRRPDLTNEIKSALEAPEVADESEYPESPSVKDTVYDCQLNVLKRWDGSRWVTLVTRAGLASELAR